MYFLKVGLMAADRAYISRKKLFSETDSGFKYLVFINKIKFCDSSYSSEIELQGDALKMTLRIKRNDEEALAQATKGSLCASSEKLVFAQHLAIQPANENFQLAGSTVTLEPGRRRIKTLDICNVNHKRGA